MAISEKVQHDILLIIITALFILFITGLESEPELPTDAIVIPD